MNEAPLTATPQDEVEQTLARAFIARWQGVAASELSTAQSFVRELCELLGVHAPHPTPDQSYMFERRRAIAALIQNELPDWKVVYEDEPLSCSAKQVEKK